MGGGWLFWRVGMALRLDLPREIEREGGSGTGRALHPDGSAHALDELVADHESQPGAGRGCPKSHE